MTPERKQQLLGAMDEMRADLMADAEKLEGAPFTGPTVARALGELSGTLYAFIEAMQAFIRESEQP